MSRHGYDDDDDFDIVDADGWKQYDSYTMRRAPQQPSIHKQLFSRITFCHACALHFVATQARTNILYSLLGHLQTSPNRGLKRHTLMERL